MTGAAADYGFGDVHEGDVFKRAYRVERESYEHFLAAFHDHSPLHMDGTYARAHGFRSVVVHGSVLNGFVSHFVGMCMPGRRALLLSVELNYAAPCYIGDELTLEAKVVQKVEAVSTLVVHIVFNNDTQGAVAARGRLQVKIRSEI